MTDRGVANLPLLIGFHSWVALGLSLRCKLRLVLKLPVVIVAPNTASHCTLTAEVQTHSGSQWKSEKC